MDEEQAVALDRDTRWSGIGLDQQVGTMNRLLRKACSVILLLYVAAGGELGAQQVVGASLWYEPLPEPTLETSAAVPIVLNNGRTIFLNRVSYQNVVYHFEEWGFAEGDAEDMERFHSITYSLIYLQQLAEKWRLLLAANPSLSSDFGSDISADDFFLSLQGGFTAQILENLSLGLALLYNLGDLYPYPGALIEWKITKDLVLSGILPVFATLEYGISRYLDLGLQANLEFRSHHGDPDKYGLENPQFSFIFARAGGYVQANVMSWLHLNVEGGYYFYRYLSFGNGNEEQESLFLDNAFYIKGGLIVGF
jgi:hypothetical protein